MFVGYQVSTNSMISFGFNTKKTKPSVTISIGSIGKVSFGYSGGISWTKSWIEFSLAHSPKKGFTFGYSAKISIPHWMSLGLIAACVAVPFLATFGGTVITAIGASLTVAANALIPLLPKFCNAIL